LANRETCATIAQPVAQALSKPDPWGTTMEILRLVAAIQGVYGLLNLLGGVLLIGEPILHTRECFKRRPPR